MTRFNWCNAVVLAACALAVEGASAGAGEPTKRGGTDRKWDEVTAASNELSDILFYLEDV